MLRSDRLPLRCLTAIVAFAGIASSVLAAGPRRDQPYYTYQGDTIPLLIDATRIAVFDRGLAAPDVRDASARKMGLAEAALEAGPQDGWLYVSNPDPAQRTEQGAVNFADRISANVNADFVSPVYVDQYGPRLIKREILIGFHADIAPAEAEQLIKDLQLGEIVARDWANIPNAFMVRTNLKNGADVLALANTVAERPEVEWSEPDMVFTAEQLFIPNDPLFGSQWGLRQANDIDMDVDEAWDITTGSNAIITAVFDTGTQLNHPDLNVAPGTDFTGNNTSGGPSTSCDNHGTAVAGCISARVNNGIGVAGVAPGTRVAPVKTLTIAASNPCPNSGTGSNFAGAVDWARTNGARVTNASLGFGPSGAIDAAYTTARNAGVVHFAATGNDGASSIGYPSSSPSVNSVGSINTNGSRTSFSNFGTGLDFMAPGNGIWTTDRTGSAGYAGGDYTSISGTSFASPNAAGVAALILSVNSFLTPAQVESIMQTTATDLGTAGYDTQFGFGLVNARRALEQTPPPTPPGAFALQTPSNGATQVPRLPTLTWALSNFATSYEVMLDDNADFSSPILVTNTSTSSYTLTGTPLNVNSTYHWKVVSSNTLGNVNSTPTQASFTTYNIAPATFNLTAPTPGQTNVLLTPTLSWESTILAESYTVQIDDNSDFSSPVVNDTTPATSYGVPVPLAPGATYHWRVFANNLVGSTLSTPVSQSFSTLNTPPQSFMLQSPADGSNIATFEPTLNWADAVGAASYRLELDDQVGFGSPEIVASNLTDSTFTVPPGILQNITRYYWRVFAVNNIGETLSSPNAYNFAVIVETFTCCQGNADKITPGSVTFGDVSFVLANFGASYPNQQGLGDADCNGLVNFSDITGVLANFGNFCP